MFFHGFSMTHSELTDEGNNSTDNHSALSIDYSTKYRHLQSELYKAIDNIGKQLVRESDWKMLEQCMAEEHLVSGKRLEKVRSILASDDMHLYLLSLLNLSSQEIARTINLDEEIVLHRLGEIQKRLGNNSVE